MGNESKWLRAKVGENILRKIKIGLHRADDIQKQVLRLSKMTDENKIKEEVEQIAAAKYSAGSQNYIAFCQTFYKDIKKTKFERENSRMLKSLYDSVKKFQRKRLDNNMLSEKCKRFYEKVSSAKSYDEFVDKVCEQPKFFEQQQVEIEYLSRYLNELKLKTSSGRTKEIKIDVDGRVETVEILSDYKLFGLDAKNKINILIGRSEDLNPQYNDLCDRLVDLAKEVGKEDFETQDYNSLRNELSALAVSGKTQKILKESWNKIFNSGFEKKITFNRLFGGLNNKMVYSRYRNKHKELNDLIGFICLLYVDYSIEKLNKIYNEKLGKVKQKIRTLEMAKLKKERNESPHTASSHNNSAHTAAGGANVAELRKKFGGGDTPTKDAPKTGTPSRSNVERIKKVFEKEPIMGVRKNR